MSGESRAQAQAASLAKGSSHPQRQDRRIRGCIAATSQVTPAQAVPRPRSFLPKLPALQTSDCPGSSGRRRVYKGRGCDSLGLAVLRNRPL